MSHGDLLLVQSQSVWGRRRFAPATVLISQHGRFGHLRMEERKKVIAAPLGGTFRPSSCKEKAVILISELTIGGIAAALCLSCFRSMGFCRGDEMTPS